MFRRNLTKWKPFGNYSRCDTDYIVFFRANRSTGMMYFRVKKVQKRSLYHSNFLPYGLIDVKKQWEEMLSDISQEDHKQKRPNG